MVRQAGFTLAEISSLIRLRRSGRRVRDGLLAAKLAEVQRDIRHLQAIERALVTAIGCDCGSLEHCPTLPPAQAVAGTGCRRTGPASYAAPRARDAAPRTRDGESGPSAARWPP